MTASSSQLLHAEVTDQIIVPASRCSVPIRTIRLIRVRFPILNIVPLAGAAMQAVR